MGFPGGLQESNLRLERRLCRVTLRGLQMLQHHIRRQWRLGQDGTLIKCLADFAHPQGLPSLK